MVGILASGPSCPGFDSKHSQKKLREKIVDVAEVYQLCCLEESGQWLQNVDQSHLVLAGGKLVLQKITDHNFFGWIRTQVTGAQLNYTMSP